MNRKELPEDLEKLEQERVKLAKEVSATRNKLSTKLYHLIGDTLRDFEEETGFMVSEIAIDFDRYVTFGSIKPTHRFINVRAKLDIEEQL